VIGTCLAMGACDWEANCEDPANQWAHDDCVGHAVCEQGQCEWICEGGAGEGEACGDNGVDCAAGLYCATGWCGTPPVIGVCLPMGACDWEGNCYDEANEWAHIECDGSALCVDAQCAWECS
jgi:hypothetical protein